MTKTRTKKSGWRVFLTPSWIFTAIFVIAFSYLAFTILSPWQLNKDHDIQQRNERISEAFAVDPVQYQDVFDSDGTIRNDDLEWRRIELTGHYVTDSEVLLRMRSVNDTPNYQSLVGFETTDDDFFLVHRGYVPTTAETMPEIDSPPNGEITITGVARRTEGMPRTDPMEADGYRQVYGINTEQIGDLTGLNLGVDYIQLLDEQPGVLTAMPIPKLDRGNHLSYGLQWIAFGIMAPLGLLYFIRSEIKERRKVAAEEAAMAASVAEDSPTDTPKEAPELSDAELRDATPADTALTSPDSTEPSQPATSTPSDEGDQQTAPVAAIHSPQRSRSRYGTTHQNRWAKDNDRRKNF
ncbi:MAG: SURF1 family protein [Corynebacterium sp.]|nr:SURF1 family protein [Corynebacterium sp.]